MFDLVEMKKGIDVNRMDINWQIELLSSPIRTKNDKIKLKIDSLIKLFPLALTVFISIHIAGAVC